MNSQPVSPEILKNAFYEHHTGLHRYAYTLVHENEAARDIVQQVFVTLCEQPEKFRITVSLKSYLYRAVYNRCINHKTRTVQHSSLEKINGPDSASVQRYPGEAIELRNKIRAAIDRLPPQCRTVFLKSREESLSYARIAADMGIAVKTVEAQMTKALKLLREELQPYLYTFFPITFLIAGGLSCL